MIAIRQFAKRLAFAEFAWSENRKGAQSRRKGFCHEQRFAVWGETNAVGVLKVCCYTLNVGAVRAGVIDTALALGWLVK